MRNFVIVVLIFCNTYLFYAQTNSKQETIYLAQYSENTLKKEAVIANFDFTIKEAGISTKYTDYGTSFFMDKYIVVSAKKIGAFGSKKDSITNEPYTEFYCTDISTDGALSRPLLFSRFINSVKNETGVTFSPNEHTIYFTRSSHEDSTLHHLFRADLDTISQNEWQHEKQLLPQFNKYSIESPCMSSDGKKLYFSSNMKGSLGGFDLFVVDILDDGTLSEPINLGPNINTVKDEKTPYISKDQQALYFSSNGYNGLGNLDIYFAEVHSGGFSDPINMGSNINSTKDDYAFIQSSDTTGYLSSNRLSGKGKSDVYAFIKKETIQTLNIAVKHLLNNTPLPESKLTILNENGDILETLETTDKGIVSYTIKPYKNYTIKITKEGFADQYINFKSIDVHHQDYNKVVSLQPLIKKEPVALKMNKIYFDFDKYQLKEQAQTVLDTLVKLLQDQSHIKVEVHAHTDNKGSKSYNLLLSKKRAQEAINYLIGKGIEKQRLAYISHGENQPFITCNKDCTDKDHGYNRRIEFTIIK